MRYIETQEYKDWQEDRKLAQERFQAELNAIDDKHMLIRISMEATK